MPLQIIMRQVIVCRSDNFMKWQLIHRRLSHSPYSKINIYIIAQSNILSLQNLDI